MLAIVDYGRGNLWSVQNGFAQVGAQVQISGDPAIITGADAVVFPGVGAFRDCMHNLLASGLDQALHEVIQAGKPVLAICVGMQALLSESEEFGRTPGLGIFEGQVRRFPATLPASATRLKVPHMAGISCSSNAPVLSSQGSLTVPLPILCIRTMPHQRMRRR